MKICAIISEYNPFHSGHKYHVEKSKNITNADCIIAVMSGNFTQRGEPALFDKWTRAKCAIDGGVNLVVELPFCFAAQTAQIFAEGAVKMIDTMNCVDFISFGSECGNVDELRNAIYSISDEKIKQELKTGRSFPSAISNASDDAVFEPNNILGMEYIKAADKYARNIKLVTVKREGEGYNEDGAEGKYISASSCRKLIKEGNYDVLKKYLQPQTFNLLKQCIKNGRYFDADLFGAVVLSDARRGRITEVVPYVSEGIENRIFRAAQAACDYYTLLENIKTKRYTHNRIRRIFCNSAVGITKKDIEDFRCEGTKYLNVLAADETGHKALRLIKKSSEMQIISKHSDGDKLSGLQKKMIETDFVASSVYSICMKNKEYRSTDTEIKRS